MAFSYDSTLLTAMDKVRFRLGDILSTKAILQDEEILSVLTDYNQDVPQTTLFLARMVMLPRFAQMATTIAAPDLRVEFDNRVAAFKDYLSVLQQTVPLFTPMPYAGGISVTEKEAQQDDTDRVRPSFGVTSSRTETE